MVLLTKHCPCKFEQVTFIAVGELHRSVCPPKDVQEPVGQLNLKRLVRPRVPSRTSGWRSIAMSRFVVLCPYSPTRRVPFHIVHCVTHGKLSSFPFGFTVPARTSRSATIVRQRCPPRADRLCNCQLPPCTPQADRPVCSLRKGEQSLGERHENRALSVSCVVGVSLVLRLCSRLSSILVFVRLKAGVRSFPEYDFPGWDALGPPGHNSHFDPSGVQSVSHFLVLCVIISGV